MRSEAKCCYEGSAQHILHRHPNIPLPGATSILTHSNPDALRSLAHHSYPIFHIPGYHESQQAGHPKNVIFLTCDAYGVLPPVSKLTSGQALYQFVSGYTSKVAGTERGITEPTATFSACFGAAFLTLHPTRYAELLQEKLEKHNSNAYLVNTGWTGGGNGVGQRMR